MVSVRSTGTVSRLATFADVWMRKEESFQCAGVVPHCGGDVVMPA